MYGPRLAIVQGPCRHGHRRAKPRKLRPAQAVLAFEPLEERCLLALLGLAAMAQKPDIASGGTTNLSYNQPGHPNTLLYSATALSITMPDGSLDPITKQNSSAPASTRLSLTLDSMGNLGSGSFTVSGHVTIGSTTYDGTLLTGTAQDFGSGTPSLPDTEFEVRILITGGQLTQGSGPYQVNGELGLLIHQSGLTIAHFPATFTYTGPGVSDAPGLPGWTHRLQRTPTPGDKEPPTNDQIPGTPQSSSSSSNCGCNPSSTPGSSTGADSTGGSPTSLFDGAPTQQMNDLTIPGTGLPWSVSQTYRGDVTVNGPLGPGWSMNENQYLETVTPGNLSTIQSVYPSAKVGDVLEVNGTTNRDELYVQNSDGSYTDPGGFYTQLTYNSSNGTYSERLPNGTVWSYARADGQGIATPTIETDRYGNTLRFTYNDSEQLTFVYDSMGRPIQYTYNAQGLLTQVQDYMGRTVTFGYDSQGDLTSVTSPAVTGTPTGNDFPSGVTTRYAYDTSHRLTSVTAPNEVANSGPPYLQYAYDTQGRVMSVQLGGTNSTNVPAGGTITYSYQSLGSPSSSTDTTTAVRQTTVTDRNGNVTIYQYNQFNNTIDVKQETRGLRPGDPSFYETQYQYDTNYRLTQVQLPAGNTISYTYDTGNPNRAQQGDLLSVTQTPDAARGGDQTAITTTYTYEPIYDQVHTMTDPRGNDPSYVPQNGGSQSAARYTTTYTYDYQEGTNFSALGAILGISASAAQSLLISAGIPMGLGDVNGDGTTSQLSGNLIRIQQPNVNLSPTSNEAAAEGTSLQPIVTLYSYNSFGQLTRTTDPEGNVTAYTYYPQRDPGGTGVILNPKGNATTGGYLKQTVIDAAYGPTRDTSTNPAPARITTTYHYDVAGNVTSVVDSRGIAINYVYNALNQVVEVIHAAAVNQTTPTVAEPLALTAFGYIERYFYDDNGNMVLHQVEDRGDTSGVAGNPPAADQSPYAPNPHPAGGPYFVDTVMIYDIVNHPVERIQEVRNEVNPEFLVTRYRYDANGNQTLTILPEGNATSTTYDERNLPLETSRGEDTAPSGTLLAPGDPTNYDVRSGSVCVCTSYRYDANGNVIETVDDDNNNVGSTANTDPSLGPGNRTLYIYDGFDRRTSVIDAVGDQTVYQYDPEGNVTRTLHFGPTGGASPTSNGPLPPAEPVSQGGVIQSSHLVSSNLLSATETSYDELNRAIQTSQVLFVNTIATTRTPDVAEGGSAVGLGNLTPGQTQAIPGVSGVTILGRVSDRTEYDRDSRTTFQVEDDLNTTRNFYDGAGRVIRTVDSAGNSVQTAYDGDGHVIETRETDVTSVGGVPSETFLTTSFYDSLGRVQETVDNLGHTMDYRYDSRGNLVATADADGPAGPTISRRAFSSGSRTVNTTNLYGNVTLYTYDGLNRMIREEQILTATGQGDGMNIGATLEGIKTTTPTPDPAQGGGDGIIRTEMIYDGDSNLVAQIDDNGNVTVSLYDNANHKVAESEGLTVNSAYTNANLFGPRVIPMPTAATIDNPATIPTSQIDTQLAETKSRIDEVASLFPSLANQVVDSPPTTQIWGYSGNNIVLIYQDGNGDETFTKYDAIDRPVAVRVFRAGQSDSFTGDPIFAPAPVNPIPTNPTHSYPATGGTTIQNYQYDGLSRVVSAYDNNDPTNPGTTSTVTTAYDSLGRVIEDTQTTGSQPPEAIDSAWRGDSLRSSLTYPDGRVETYQYDALDRIRQVSDQGASMPIAVYDYIGATRVLDRLEPIDGVRETYLNNAGTQDIGYDGLRRTVEIRDVSAGNATIIGFAYTYDRVGNKLTQVKLYDPANSEVYTYDSAYRLISFQRPGAGAIAPQETVWTLDGVGNFTTINGQSQQYSSTNAVTQFNKGAGATAVNSDDNGNEIDDGTYLYTWDFHNRLTTVRRKSDNALIAEYAYDATGRRILTVVTNSGATLNGTTYFYLDGQTEIEEHNASGQVTQQYVFGVATDEALVLDRNPLGPSSQRFFYQQDAQGSVYGLTNTSGHLIEAYQYDAYGRPTVFDPGITGVILFGPGDVITSDGVGQVGNRFLFTGLRFDGETTLYYVRARYLNTDQGRFVSRDPMGYAEGMNFYEYAMDRPEVLNDPSGEIVQVCCAPIVLLVAAGVLSGYALAGIPGAVLGGTAGSLPQHCWVKVICPPFPTIDAELQPHLGAWPGPPPRFAWLPRGIRLGAVGVPSLRTPGLLAPPGRCTTCSNKCNCAAERACVLGAMAAYPIGTYGFPSPNSNTFASTVAATCCAKPLPAGIPPLLPGQFAPGWGAAPPAPIPGVRIIL